VATLPYAQNLAWEPNLLTGSEAELKRISRTSGNSCTLLDKLQPRTNVYRRRLRKCNREILASMSPPSIFVNVTKFSCSGLFSSAVCHRTSKRVHIQSGYTKMVHVVSYSIKREHTTVQPTNMLHLFKCIASPSRTTSSLPYRLTEYNI
jgi:hypothetical protein